MRNIVVLLIFFFNVFSFKSQSLPAFNPAPFPQSACNNLMGNYTNQWRPSHGSPNIIDLGCGNKVVRLYSKNESITTRKSEGIFIDLNNIGVNIDTSKKYRIIVSYRYSIPSNPNRAVNFDVYLANNMVEKSNNNCEEETFPNVSDKMKILTFASGEFLDDTYTCQVKSKEQGQIVPNNSYKYLWIVSNLNTTLNYREYVDIDKIELYYDNSGTNAICNLSKPNNLLANDLTYNSASIAWNPVPNASKYRVRYYLQNTQDYNNFETSNTSIAFNSLLPSTAYQADVTPICSNGIIDGNNVSYLKFNTANCPIISSNITAVPYGNWYKIEFTDVPNFSKYYIEWVDLVDNTSGKSEIQASNHIFYYNNNPHQFKFRLAVNQYCSNWTDWITVNPINYGCNLNESPTNLTVSSNCSYPGRVCEFAIFNWSAINNVVSYQVEYQIFSLTNPSQVKVGVFETNNNYTYYQGAQAYDFTGNVLIKFRVRYKCMDGIWSSFTNWSSNFAW